MQTIKNLNDYLVNLSNLEFKNEIQNLIIDTINIQKLFYIYKDQKIDVVAVNDLTISFKPGDINVLMGPSGSGKSTFLNIIGGIFEPSSGSIALNSYNIHRLGSDKLRMYRKKKIGFIFQSKNLIPYLNIEDNIKLGVDLSSRKLQSSKKKEVNNLIERFELTKYRKHLPSEISGGQRQKASISVVLAKDPQIIIADEPTGNLDSKSRDQILDLFLEMKRENPKRIIIIVTHDPAFLKIADFAYYIKDGRISSTLDTIRQPKIHAHGTNKNLIYVDSAKFEKMKEIVSEFKILIDKIENHNEIGGGMDPII